MPNRPTRPTEPREPGLLPRGVTICRGCGGLGFDCSMGACRVCGGTGRVRGNATSCAHCGGRLFVDPDRLPDGTYERSCVRCGARSYLDAKGHVMAPERPPSAPLVTTRFDADSQRYTLDEEVDDAGDESEDEGYRDDDEDEDEGEGSQSA